MSIQQSTSRFSGGQCPYDKVLPGSSKDNVNSTKYFQRPRRTMLIRQSTSRLSERQCQSDKVLPDSPEDNVNTTKYFQALRWTMSIQQSTSSARGGQCQSDKVLPAPAKDNVNPTKYFQRPRRTMLIRQSTYPSISCAFSIISSTISAALCSFTTGRRFCPDQSDMNSPSPCLAAAPLILFVAEF